MGGLFRVFSFGAFASEYGVLCGCGGMGLFIGSFERTELIF